MSVDGDTGKQLARFLTDDWFVRPTLSMLRGMNRVGSMAWQYEFTRVSPYLPALGAHHAVEIPYVFGREGELPGLADRKLSPGSDGTVLGSCGC